MNIVGRYFDVFAWADTHPQAKQFYEEGLAEIRLGETIYQEKIKNSERMIKCEIDNTEFPNGIDE